jgi:hypothetical protein
MKRFIENVVIGDSLAGGAGQIVVPLAAENGAGFSA